MEIADKNLQFSNTLRKRLITHRIIVHHSASPDVPVNVVHDWHLNRGWSGVGYHYIIRTNGAIERGRPEDTIGAHAGSQGNSDSIGICVMGNFTYVVPTELQIKSLVNLIKDIASRYGDLELIRHKDIMATACPGDSFPWDELNYKLKEQTGEVEAWKIDIMNRAKEKGLISSDHGANEKADKWFVLAVALNLLESLKK